MKKALIAAAIGLLLCTAIQAEVKKKIILDLEKGMPNDFSNCDLEIIPAVDAQSPTYLKIIPKPGEVLVGMMRPRVKIWDGYDLVKFDYINEGKTPLEWAMIIYPPAGNYHTRADLKFVCRPGKGTVELEIAGINSNFSGPMDWKKPVDKWHFYGPLAGPLQIGSVTLETKEEEKPKK